MLTVTPVIAAAYLIDNFPLSVIADETKWKPAADNQVDHCDDLTEGLTENDTYDNRAVVFSAAATIAQCIEEEPEASPSVILGMAAGRMM